MTTPAMPTPVDAHQVEFFPRKKNRMHPCPPGQVFTAKRAVAAVGNFVRLFKFTAVPIVPVFPVPEQQCQC